MEIIQLNLEDYKNIKNQTVFFDFGATWCGPCKQMDPIIEEQIAPSFPETQFYKIDVDEQPEIAAAHGIRSMPTLLVVHFDEEGNSTELLKVIGLQSDILGLKQAISDAISQASSTSIAA